MPQHLNNTDGLLKDKYSGKVTEQGGHKVGGFLDLISGSNRKKTIDKAVGDEPESKVTTTTEAASPMPDSELDAKMEAYKKKYGGFQKTGK